jgi:hypothetical protein
MVTGNWPAQADALRPSIFLEKSSAKTEWAFGDKSNCFDSDTDVVVSVYTMNFVLRPYLTATTGQGASRITY